MLWCVVWCAMDVPVGIREAVGAKAIDRCVCGQKTKGRKREKERKKWLPVCVCVCVDAAAQVSTNTHTHTHLNSWPATEREADWALSLICV